MALTLGLPVTAQAVPDNLVTNYFELRSILKNNIKKCIYLVYTSSRNDRFECLDLVNEGSRGFNNLTDRICGKRAAFEGSTFCLRATDRMPILRIEVKVDSGES
jgi:hypothetical protein